MPGLALAYYGSSSSTRTMSSPSSMEPHRDSMTPSCAVGYCRAGDVYLYSALTAAAGIVTTVSVIGPGIASRSRDLHMPAIQSFREEQ